MLYILREHLDLRIEHIPIGLYTLDHDTVSKFSTDRLVCSAPFVVLGLVRFAYLALWRPKDESPTEAMLRDPWFLLDLAAATATVLYIIYG